MNEKLAEALGYVDEKYVSAAQSEKSGNTIGLWRWRRCWLWCWC